MAREASRVQVTVKDIQGTGKCPLGHKKGDTWLIENSFTPTNFCMIAFAAVYPAIRTMRYGGEHPWGESDIKVSQSAWVWFHPASSFRPMARGISRGVRFR